MATKSDIIEDNLRAGVMEHWNVGYREIKKINPGIIFLEKNGFGQWGPYAEQNRPSNDGASQAFSGLSWMSRFAGQTPLKQANYLCDMYGALMAEIAVLSALHYRDRTGKGQYIEISQTEAIMRAMSWIWPYHHLTQTCPEPSGNRDVSICPADSFRTRTDALVSIAAPAPEEFQGLCRAMNQPGLAEDPRFKTHLARLKEENATELLAIIADWVRGKTPEEIEALAEEHHFAASRVCNVKEVVENVHYRERGFMTQVDDSLYGKYLDSEFPVMMSKSSPQKKWTARPVGFDNEFVMTNVLGKSKTDIQRLYDCGALGRWADVPGRRPPEDWNGEAGRILSREDYQPN
jgi:crotonobetainyl-CoA:carnitine CoA-transferase CaiB-like acyl-CoA transferase